MPHAAEVNVLLLNMGGPDSLQAVPHFMRNLFNDRDIFRFPLGAVTQPFFARLITRLRARKVQAQYAAIGGSSPLAALSHAQAIALRATLRRRGLETAVAVGMRYWRPFAREALESLLRQAIEAPLVALPLYPHYSKATTGSSLSDLDRAMKALDLAGRPHTITAYYNHPLYIEALAQRIAESLEAADDSAEVLFSAHGLPESFVEAGDPYVSQIEETFRLAGERFPRRAFHLAYQSRVGPVKWVGPSIEEKLEELAARGVKALRVVPVSFVSDHIETLYEIDVTYGDLARRLGIESFQRIRSLNGSPLFIDCLADLVLEALRKEPQ